MHTGRRLSARPSKGAVISARTLSHALGGLVLIVGLSWGPIAEAAAPATGGEATASSSKDAAKRKAALEAAEAHDRLTRSIRVIQQRPFVHSLRFELQLGGGVGLNDDLHQQLQAMAVGRMHIDEQWAVGVDYLHYFSSESAFFDKLVQDFEVFPERSRQHFYGGLEVSYAPVYGKFTAFDAAIVHFDVYLLAGVGVTQTNRSADLKPAGMVGLGWRTVITRWFTFNLELRDHLFVEKFRHGSKLWNNVVATAGFGFFLPFDHDYRYPR